MTNEYMLQTALKQSAIDSNCRPEDFLSGKNLVVLSAPHMNARKYLELPFYCDLTSYGNNIVASVNPEIEPLVRAYLERFDTAHCFETPNMYVLNEALQERDMKICFMAEYFLPDVLGMREPEPPEGIKIRPLYPDDFASLYTPFWSNALCEKRKHLDVLAMGAYDGDTLAGLAGCSADCEEMRQIGVDTLETYRGRGIAAALVNALARAVMEDGLVPFYCAAWSNVKSVRTALKSGFKPAWVQMTAKSAEFVRNMNEEKIR